MESFAAGGLRLEVDHTPEQNRSRLQVRAAGDRDRGRVWLDFECSYTQGSCRIDPEGAGRSLSAPPGEDPLEWILALLHDGAAELLRGLAEAPRDLDSDRLAALLPSVEIALRNPPVAFDAVSPEKRRPSHGEKWTTYPEDVLPLWVADMDLPVAEPVRRTLARAVLRSGLGYPIHPAPTPVPELTVARMQTRFGWSPDPARVEILSDVVQGMYVAVHQLTEVGDGILVLPPIYPPFFKCAAYAGRRRVEVPLAESARRYRVDLERLDAAVDASTRAILLCNPHNPTGRVFTREELEGIAQLALRHDLVVVSDEIHSDLVYPDREHIPIASLSPEIEARTLTLNAASKAFNMAGLRCAVAIFGSDELARRFRGLSRHIRGGVGLPGIEALQAAWRHGDPWHQRALAYLASNRDFTVETIRRELPGVLVEPPEATYLAWLDCREAELPGDPYRFFLDRARVALSPGPSFGAVGAGFVRINFATSRAILSEALERMAKAMKDR